MFKWNPFVMEGEAPASMRFVSGGSSGSKGVPFPVSTLSRPQKGVMKTLGEKIQEGIDEGIPSYPGQMYVERTPEEEAYFSGVGGAVNNLAAIRANMAKPAFEVSPETTANFYEYGIRAPALREYEEITKPAIKEAFVGPGYWGSARAQEESRSAENLATQLSAQRAALEYADVQAYREAQEAAKAREAAYGPATITAETEQLGTAGQYARMIEQEEATANLQRWLMGESVEGQQAFIYSPYIQAALSFLDLQPYQVGVYSKSSSSQWGVLS